MTETEKILLLAFVDNSISQLQSLRGAISVLSKTKEMQSSKEVVVAQENLFAKRFDAMLESVHQGNEDGDVPE
jgi:hypothetical protein